MDFQRKTSLMKIERCNLYYMTSKKDSNFTALNKVHLMPLHFEIRVGQDSVDTYAMVGDVVLVRVTIYLYVLVGISVNS